ncbi:MAG: hypothetical protein K6G60_05940 [Lachnospiraceae bacterium]|nr:hypothetical protein [Lachnospiraceae bacterium]
MIDRILKALKNNNVSIYRLRDTVTESTEVFFVKKKLDTRRIANTETVSVTVYREFEKDGVKFLGDANFSVEPSMSEEIIDSKIKKAFMSAGFVTNKAYDLAEKLVSDVVEVESNIADIPVDEALGKMVEALYRNDTDSNTFINSAELFLTKHKSRVMTGNGVDVAWIQYGVNGEYVCQCKTPEDVETYASFDYDNLECEQLAEKVKETLAMTRDRSVAVANPVNGKADIVLPNRYAEEVLNYYLVQTDAFYNFAGYFENKVGSFVQGKEEEISGDRITMDLLPVAPFNGDGIKMIERSGIEKGVMKTYQGALRFCRYLNVPAVGAYSKYRIASGDMSFEDMKKQKGLYIVNFSDFQLDPVVGCFRGEIRLAYYNDGEKIVPVTGGSVNGSIIEAQKSIRLSKERQETTTISGPKAILLKDVSVAGC